MNEEIEKLKELIEKVIDKAIEKPCKIHIDNDGKNIGIKVKGDRLSSLVTLARAEKNILKNLNCSESSFEQIKDLVCNEDKNNG